MAENIYEYIRREIRKQRIINNLTQQELADRTSVTKQSISKIERGVLSPSLDTLYDLSDALNCSIFDLLPRNDVEYSDSLNKAIDYKISCCNEKQKRFINRFIDAYLESENK